MPTGGLIPCSIPFNLHGSRASFLSHPGGRACPRLSSGTSARHIPLPGASHPAAGHSRFFGWCNPFPLFPGAPPFLAGGRRVFNKEGLETRLTWSLPPHSPAERLAAGGHSQRDVTSPTTTTLLRFYCRAGLTPKPHHAHQPIVGLRGSFRLRLASTFNHRPGSKPSNYIIIRIIDVKQRRGNGGFPRKAQRRQGIMQGGGAQRRESAMRRPSIIQATFSQETA